jgi:hypothetical protein
VAALEERFDYAQAFGHGAQAWAKYPCQSHARILTTDWHG